MKKLIVTIALSSLFCIPVLAQDTPAVEVYGGYQLLHHGGGTYGELTYDSYNLNGFLASVEGNVKPYFGIVGEFGYNRKSWDEYSETESFTTYLFGPRVSYRAEKFRVFGHYLLGGAHYKDDYTGGSYTDNLFTQAVGGGIDITISDLISVRPAQIDMVSVRWTDAGTYWENHFRYSGGVVFTFGK